MKVWQDQEFSKGRLIAVFAIIVMLGQIGWSNYENFEVLVRTQKLGSIGKSGETFIKTLQNSKSEFPVTVGRATENRIDSGRSNPDSTPCRTLPDDLKKICLFFPALPKSFAGDASTGCPESSYKEPSFIYMSDGPNYKLVINCTGTTTLNKLSQHSDPHRPGFALAFTNNASVTSAW